VSVPESTARTIQLLLVDDHAMFREGLVRMLEKEADLKVVGQCASAREALAMLPASGADMVLLDVDLGSERALDFVIGSRAKGFQGQILVVTAGMSDQEALQLMQAGVAGILHKHHSASVLCGAIRQMARGEVYMEKTYLGPLLRSVDRSRPPARPLLTERDKTVLRSVFQGLTNREIAARLQISEGAVKASLRQVFDKLGVRTRAQLVKVALEQYRDQL
jgi:two-component system, NarL family, nitrate/nitrite response regulator NarL